MDWGKTKQVLGIDRDAEPQEPQRGSWEANIHVSVLAQTSWMN